MWYDVCVIDWKRYDLEWLLLLWWYVCVYDDSSIVCSIFICGIWDEKIWDEKIWDWYLIVLIVIMIWYWIEDWMVRYDSDWMEGSLIMRRLIMIDVCMVGEYDMIVFDFWYKIMMSILIYLDWLIVY